MWTETEIDAQEEIELAVDSIRAEIPPAIKTDISRCNADLYHGPLYFNADDELCSHLDEGAKPFDFVAALKRVRTWADDIDDIKIEVAFDDETGESAYERLDGSSHAILKKIVGSELARML